MRTTQPEVPDRPEKNIQGSEFAGGDPPAPHAHTTMGTCRPGMRICSSNPRAAMPSVATGGLVYIRVAFV